ncbi:helix-turn-helix transcriptional regulator [Amycolatopsis sp. NPDC051373]|uniref:helix-turn-helix domain-containing protein n=1 Tax=Amycolatopsis sp. NPDC051373 TaxID=3155801 RepID=UPI00344CF0F1
MIVPNPPSLRRRRLVSALRRLRTEAGLTIVDAAEAAGFSEAKLSRIETLRHMVNGDDTYRLAQVYGADQQTTDALVQLARSSKQRGWWAAYSDDALDRLTDYIEMQADAVRIREFEEGIVPGALQTRGYTEAVLRFGLPDASEETIQQRLKVRTELQESARSRDLRMWVILDEMALRRPVGGRGVMADQVAALISAANSPGIRLQVLPTDVSGHPAMGTPFTLLDLADRATYVYLDTLTGGSYLEEARDVDRYESTWEVLQATALGFDDSTNLMATIRSEHQGG